MSTTDAEPGTAGPAPVRVPGPLLPVPERVQIAVIVLTLLASMALTTLRGQSIAWTAFLPVFVACGLLVVIGTYLRARKGAPRLALGVIGFAVFMGFTAAVSIFIYALFPLSAPLIDLALIRADAALGYDWVAFVSGLADWPAFGTALGYVYRSSLVQIIGVVVLLAWLGRATELYRFQLVGMVSVAVTVLIWNSFPSLGPAAWASVPAEVQDRIGLVVDAGYGAELRRLAQDGPQVISPDRVIGVIAFPSFHMVMACMVVWFTRATPLFLPALVLNLAMVPATLSHGGHHLVDVIAGVLLMGLCLMVVRRALPSAGPATPG
jgi:hypothetical protein